MKKLLRSLFLILMIAVQALAQDKTVTGTVTAKEDGLPLPGVSVKVVGTQLGTLTGPNGKFSINVPAGNKSLSFTYIGYVGQTKAIGSESSTINVILVADATQLGEVVVTSFGIQRDKKSLGYGTSAIESEALTTAKTTNVTNALTAKVPGIRATGTGGAFTGSGVIIRGYTTFTGSNQPLYVVDGVPIDNGGGGQALQTGASASNRAIDINPDDIENVTVLKGAAATVLYGSRAASGAILITTKKGSRGEKNAIAYSTSYNVGNVNRLPDYQNEYAQGNNGIYNPAIATSWGPRISGQTVTNFFGEQETLQAYQNNVEDIFKQAYNWQNNLSFSGGTDKSNYRISYGNATETYVIDNNKLRRHNLTLNGSTQITKKLMVGTSVTYTNNNSVRTLQGNQLSNPLFRAYFTPRSYDLTNTPFEDESGNQLWYGGEDHPYWSIKYNNYNDDVNRVFGNVNARYDVTDWLVADLKVGTDFYNLRSKGFDEVGNRGGGFAGASSRLVGGIVDTENDVRNFNSYFTVTGSKQVSNFNLSLTLGNEITQNFSSFSDVTGFELVVPGFNNLSNAITFDPNRGTQRTRLLGIFGDLVVDYKNFLTLNLKARNDWSSTLIKENRSIFYPAIAASFVATEAFAGLKSDNVNLIKIRANVGEVGKGAPAYSTDTYFVTASAGDGFGPSIVFPYNGLAGFELSNGAGQPDLEPEFTRESEIGAELGFFNSRLTFDGSYYERKTRNVILAVPVSNASGIGTVFRNAGKLSTKGVEFIIGGTPLKTKNGSWDLSLNFTQFKSTVDELAAGVDNIFLGGFTTPNIRLVAGDEYGQIYGSRYERNEQGQLLIRANGLPRATAGVEKIGNPNPQWTMGVTNNINFKGFNLGFLLDIRKGGDQYSRNIADVERNGVALTTADNPRFEADGVTQTTPYLYEGVYEAGTPNAGQPNTTSVSTQSYYGNTGKYVAAEGFIFDTSWFRIREASLTYKLPAALLQKSPFGNVEVGVFGRNLYLRAPNYPHFDPEQNALGISNAQGLEFNSLPATRTFGANLRITL